MRYLLTVAGMVVLFAISASVGFAGEVNKPHGYIAGSDAASLNGNSLCAYSGLNDNYVFGTTGPGNPDGDGFTQVQNWGHVVIQMGGNAGGGGAGPNGCNPRRRSRRSGEVDVVRGARTRREREAVAAMKNEATSALLGDEDVLDAREPRERRDDLTLRAARRIAERVRERRRRGAVRRRDPDERHASGNCGRVTRGRAREQRGEGAGSAGPRARDGHRHLRQRRMLCQLSYRGKHGVL